MSLVLLLPLLLGGGCAFGKQDVNEPLDPVAIAALRPGETTARQVVETLGGPTEVVQLGRRTAYRYDATRTKTTGLVLILFNLFGQDTRSDRLWVFFDENDVLSHYGASFGTHRTQYALPWEDPHEPEDNAARDADRPGLGTSGKDE